MTQVTITGSEGSDGSTLNSLGLLRKTFQDPTEPPPPPPNTVNLSEIAGIVVGTVAGIVICVVLIAWLHRRSATGPVSAFDIPLSRTSSEGSSAPLRSAEPLASESFA